VPADQSAPAPGRARNDAIDIVRGIVMVLMALDHARDFTMGGLGRGGPTNLATTTVPLFFTRWITHFCAPSFVLLAGVGAGLARRKKDAPELAWFLFTRGLWLLLLEITVVRTGWMLNLNYHFVVLQVIWAIGVSMVLLAPFVYLPPIAAGAWGLLLVVAHNLLDGVHAASLGSAGGLWHLVHEQGRLQPTSWTTLMVAYPLVPWVGVMACGYALGRVLPENDVERKRFFLRLGLALTALFVVLRGIDHYGDPHPWTTQPRGAVFTLLSFLNCEKYPPSLDYLLMTIGPTLVGIALLEQRPLNFFTRAMRTFGRVPLFYYMLHLYALHAVTLLFLLPQLGDPAMRAKLSENFGAPGWGLGSAYLVWAVTVVALYPACRWFEKVKQRSRNPWLSYL
jgi:uncharacterized membrane protein